MRKLGVLAVAVMFVAVSCAANTAAIWRMPGGPLVQRFRDNDGLVIPASVPRGEALYYRVPQLQGVEQPLIEHVGVVGATPGVEVLGIYVRSDGFVAAGELSVPDDDYTWVKPPARTITFSCCEGAAELLIALRLTALGEQRIDALAIDYRADLWSYHTVLQLGPWPPTLGQRASSPRAACLLPRL